jgi:hypothetical protein
MNVPPPSSPLPPSLPVPRKNCAVDHDVVAASRQWIEKNRSIPPLLVGLSFGGRTSLILGSWWRRARTTPALGGSTSFNFSPTFGRRGIWCSSFSSGSA